MVATLHEVSLLPGVGEVTARGVLPDPETAPERFCAGVGAIWENTPELARTESRYHRAASAALEAGLGEAFRYVERQSPEPAAED